MISKILVPTDGSKTALKSVKYAAELAKQETSLAGLAQQYEKKRSVLRRDLQTLQERKQGLLDRFAVTEVKQGLDHMMVVNLYLLRLQDLMKGSSTASLDKLDEGERQALKANLDMMIRLYPESRQLIQQVIPGLIEFFYPSPDAAPKADAAPTKTGA